jgi:hypothetical protein
MSEETSLPPDAEGRTRPLNPAAELLRRWQQGARRPGLAARAHSARRRLALPFQPSNHLPETRPKRGTGPPN